MIVVLPIVAPFHDKKNQFVELLSRFPGGMASIAYTALLSNGDKDSFVFEITQYLINELLSEADNDNDLVQWSTKRWCDAIGSDAFRLFLDLFFEEHNSLYSMLLGGMREHHLDNIRQAHENHCNRRKLYLHL